MLLWIRIMFVSGKAVDRKKKPYGLNLMFKYIKYVQTFSKTLEMCTVNKLKQKIDLIKRGKNVLEIVQIQLK